MVGDVDFPDISIVVVTRNRVKALEMSLPLMLSQTRSPREIIVVDSSDDPRPVEGLVRRLAADTDIPLTCIHSAPGLTRQRNIGLARVTSPVVAFPDDDSLMYETYLEEIARVYATDTDEVLVGVTVLAAGRSPLSAPAAEGRDRPVETYAPKSAGRIADTLGRFYVWVERRVIPIPYTYLRADLLRGKRLPEPVAALGCSLVADQEGFRMSFRTRYLREAPFNECLSGYALGEDIDVCYGLARMGMIARLNKPLIFHHEFPGARADGYRRGIMQIVNIGYIVARHTEPGAPARRAFAPWMRLLTAQILLRIHSAHQRERLRGVLAGRRHLGRLLSARREDADDVYLRIMESI